MNGSIYKICVIYITCINEEGGEASEGEEGGQMSHLSSFHRFKSLNIKKLKFNKKTHETKKA